MECLKEAHNAYDEIFHTLFSIFHENYKINAQSDTKEYKDMELNSLQINIAEFLHKSLGQISGKSRQKSGQHSFAKKNIISEVATNRLASSSAMILGRHSNALKDVIDYQEASDNYIELIKNNKIDKEGRFWAMQGLPDILSTKNTYSSADKILSLFRDQNTKKETKEMISLILYRMEFGKISISEQGVEYLGKMYDIGELNNPAYFAQRLTAKGDIGVFDENRVLQKYFNLGDIASEEEKVKSQINEFVYETLFYPQPNETPE